MGNYHRQVPFFPLRLSVQVPEGGSYNSDLTAPLSSSMIPHSLQDKVQSLRHNKRARLKPLETVNTENIVVYTSYVIKGENNTMIFHSILSFPMVTSCGFVCICNNNFFFLFPLLSATAYAKSLCSLLCLCFSDYNVCANHMTSC